MARLEEAEARFEAIHATDARRHDASTSAASHYHHRLAVWVERMRPEAPEAMRLAARCQHLRRWAIPRSDHPPGRAGYRAWRAALARRTAEEAGRILADVGYDEATVARVRTFLLKEGLGRDPDVQAFEDAICLAFLENELERFSERKDDDKLIAILRKTWRKMSPEGRRLAAELAETLPGRSRRLLAAL